jgi:hypothetical protein
VVERVPVTRPDQRDLVGLRSDAREQLRNLHAGLAVALELPRAAPHRRLGKIDAIGLQPFRHLGRDGFAAMFGQFGLGIERIHVAHAAVHEQVDHCFGVRRKMRRLRRQRIIRARGFQHPG